MTFVAWRATVWGMTNPQSEPLVASWAWFLLAVLMVPLQLMVTEMHETSERQRDAARAQSGGHYPPQTMPFWPTYTGLVCLGLSYATAGLALLRSAHEKLDELQNSRGDGRPAPQRSEVRSHPPLPKASPDGPTLQQMGVHFHKGVAWLIASVKKVFQRK